MTDKADLYSKSCSYLQTFCVDIPERCVGSEGNRKTTQFFEKELIFQGCKTEKAEFDAMDWKDGGATLKAEGGEFSVLVSPYSIGCSLESELVAASDRAF